MLRVNCREIPGQPAHTHVHAHAHTAQIGMNRYIHDTPVTSTKDMQTYSTSRSTQVCTLPLPLHTQNTTQMVQTHIHTRTHNAFAQ